MKKVKMIVIEVATVLAIFTNGVDALNKDDANLDVSSNFESIQEVVMTLEQYR